MKELSKTYLEIGKEYIIQNKFDLAIEHFKKICDSEDKSDQSFFELGKAYYLQNKFSLAVDAFRESIRHRTHNIHSHILLAKSYQALGQDGLAIQEFKNASEIKIDDDKIHIGLFEFFREHRMYELSIREFEEVLNNGSDKISFLDLLELYNFEGKNIKIPEKIIPLLEDSSWQEPFIKNRLLNELEISQKKLILNSKPRILLVTLTNRCNLNCYMCGKGNNVWDISPEIIEQIISYLPFLELITWQGGEVFLTKIFDNLFKKTFGLEHLKQIIITNALLIDEEWAEMLALRNNMGLTISIDSVEKDIYEYIRRGASFEKLIQNLKIINKARKRHSSNMITTLRCTIMKANYKQLEEFIEFAKDFEFNIVQMAPLSSDAYDPQNIFINKDMEILQYLTNTMPKIRDVAKRYKIKLLDWIPTLPMSNSEKQKISMLSYEDKAAEIKKPVCFRPWKQISMNVRGDIFPECLCQEPIGNAFSDTLYGVWNNEKMQMYRKVLSEYKYTDWCNPDCISGTVPPEHLKFTFV